MVEPNPIDLNRSESFSNLFNCDTQGALIYAEIAAQQIGEAIERSKAGGGVRMVRENFTLRGANATGSGSVMEADGGTMKESGENSAAEDHEDETTAGGEKSLFDKIKGLFK